MIKTFLYNFLAIILFLLFQTSVLSNITVLPAIPDLLLIYTVFIALHAGPMTGQLTGFSTGLLIDFLSAGPLGLNCLLRTLTGFSFGLFQKVLSTKGFFLPMFYVCIATLLKVILLFFISIFFPTGIVNYNLFSKTFIYEIIFNSVLAPFVFMLLSLFSSKLITQSRENF